MRMTLLLGLSMMLLASCAVGAPRWTTPGAHVVDGYWLGEETPCPLEGAVGVECRDAVIVARSSLMAEEPRSTIVAAWTAQAAEAWLDAEGNEHDKGPMRSLYSAHIVLELEDGRRRVSGALCPIGPPRELLCQPMEVFAFPEGEEPWK